MINLVGVAVGVVVILPSDDERSIGQPLNGWQRAIAVVVVGIDKSFVVEADATGTELLHLNAATVRVSYSKAAVGQRGDRWLRLITRSLGIDAELVA